MEVFGQRGEVRQLLEMCCCGSFNVYLCQEGPVTNLPNLADCRVHCLYYREHSSLGISMLTLPSVG